MQAVRVRAATLSDLPDLSRLWHEKMVIHQQLDRRLKLTLDAESRWVAAASGWLTKKNCAILIAVSDLDVLGYIIGWVQPAPPGLLPEMMGFVTDLTVDAHRPRGGVGGLLFSELKKWFLEHQIEQIIAQVPSRAAVEQAFWRAQGASNWMDGMWLKL